MEQTASQAARTTSDLRALFEADRIRALSVGRSAASVLRVYEYLRQRVVVSIARVADALALSVPTATAALGRLEALRIAREVTGKAWDHRHIGPLAETVIRPQVVA